jgi:hypothetical protein
VYISSFSLFISKAAAIGSSKGPLNSQYKLCMEALKSMIKKASI